jgi:tripartite-type tricarboxylate transporter receptor subunit TctC
MKNTFILLFFISALVLSLVAGSCSTAQTQQSPSEFFNGKTVNLVVGSEPGNLIDLVSRVMARHLGEDIKANVIVENRREAGGLEASNYLYKANPDGLTLGTAGIKFITNKVLNDPAALYDLDKFSYIFRVDKNRTYFFVSTSGHYQSISDLRAAKDLKLAAGTASGYVTLADLSIVDILGLDARVVTGFADNTARSLATQRGETAGYAVSLAAAKTDLDKGTLKPLFVLSTQREPARLDVPAITELANLSADQLALVKLWENGLSSGTLLLAPDNLPQDKLLYLRGLANGWSKNAAFTQEIDKISGFKVEEYINGEQLKQSIDEISLDLGSFQTKFNDLTSKYR